jgi:hypothetical protein
LPQVLTAANGSAAPSVGADALPRERERDHRLVNLWIARFDSEVEHLQLDRELALRREPRGIDTCVGCLDVGVVAGPPIIRAN